MKKSFADILVSMENDMRRKVSAKIPSWGSLEVPSALAFEQCSSEKTAGYKLRFVPSGAVVADLTGGLGVDTCAFASRCSKVYYFEQNEALYNAAVRNFEIMRAEPSSHLRAEIITSNETVCSSTAIPDCDLIYIDPARRSSAGKKVFLLEDCTPNVLELLPALWQHARHMLLKLSPMADISLVVKRLSEANSAIEGVGCAVQQVHVVETGGEVKELLIYMVYGCAGEVQITATDTEKSFSFMPDDERQAAPVIAMPKVGDCIYVPSGALMKAGAYNIIGLPRLSLHSHLYIVSAEACAICNDSVHPRTDAGGGAQTCLGGAEAKGRRSLQVRTPFGRLYVIDAVLPMNSKTIKELAGKYPKADVSCHDVPLRSEELAKRLKCKSGGDHHIFSSSSDEGNVLLICSKQTLSE